MKTIKFPNSFEFGTATASYQIEGAAREDGKGEDIWQRFSHIPGNITDGTNGDTACDFYHNYKEDIRLAKELGLEVFRFSVNWARIYPDGVGRINEAGIEFYRSVLRELKENGIKACLTIYHWDLPQKLQDKGGWANREIVGWFTEYAKTLFSEYGDLVDYWITLNEPWCVSMLGYWTGEHAPGYHDYSMALEAVHNLLLSHGSAVKEFRKLGIKSEIGITLNMNLAYPSDKDDPKDVEAAKRIQLQQNNLFGDPVWKGCYPEELFAYLREQDVMLPKILDGDMELISQPLDFFGLNTYYAEFVKADEEQWPLHVKAVKSGKPRTDADWEVCPDEAYELLCWIRDTYKPEKLIITENGAAFNDWVDSEGKVQDTDRIEYLKQYLEAISRAIEDGVPVMGYYVWCFTDNFEWAWGLSRRFGIIYVDYDSQKRITKESAKWFSKVIEEKGYNMA